MKNILEIGFLYDLYGRLLTEKQQEIIELYYNYDLSLGEISEQLGISRQGVHDTIKKSEQLLRDYEGKLGLFKRICDYRDTAQRLSQKLEGLEELLEKNSLDKSEYSSLLDEFKTLLKIFIEE